MNRVRVDRYNGFKLLELLRQHVPQDFDPDEFVIAGSARLWVSGAAKQLSDLDLLVRPRSRTWDRAMKLADIHGFCFGHDPTRTSAHTGDPIARLYCGVIEVCDTWVLPGSRTDDLVDAADVIDGLRYMTVPDVVAYKRYLDRPKDRSDLILLEGLSSDTVVL